MKSIYKTLINIIIVSATLTACTDVIDVDVPTAAARLVVEASIDWEKGTDGSQQTILLSTTTPYFAENKNEPVTGATVKITDNTNNETFTFTDNNDGSYTTNGFIPQLEATYSLEVIHNNEVYTATETMTKGVDIASVYQSKEGGFDDEHLEVNISFQDPEDETNYYLIRYIEEGDLFPELEVDNDEFSNGNLKKDFFEKEDDEDINRKPFIPGDKVYISLYGISERYHNYMAILIEQSEVAGDPFSAIPAALKGNVINTTNPKNQALGYFRLTQVSKAVYTFN
ncbi:DUF4249 domain-containing protein [Zhouia spongiae]|uniref:DUF4249 domain-containing protein n=1 Tax=Zhouia spongiae TaxID=2202721 RepID=A0ABY3YSG0_9FLAO|nr:DUF4249 domain-containing protein [Zhouia spongiae]UNY99723.1 DUF4249 domain-containing protein [Zhouia spongiae]